MRFTLSELADRTRGHQVGADAAVDGTTIDSREVVGGELFVAVSAERDGHEFVPAARAAGAAAVLVTRPVDDGPTLVVDDTLRALGALGRLAREHLLRARVVGVTGSVGKTTVKDLLAAVLARRYRTAASMRSFNNELGVPLTLLNAPEGCEAVVVEMGARRPDDIAVLAEIAIPTVGVVTAVSAVHTETFGDLEGVAAAKGELVEALPPSGTAVLNAEDPLVSAMSSRTRARVLRFGADGDVRAEEVVVDDELRPTFDLRSPWGDGHVRLRVRGAHQVANALAAAAAALACAVDIDDVVEGLGQTSLSPWRMDLGRTPGGAAVLNDAYNANPTSVAAALRSLASLPAGRRRIAYLGTMAELGERAGVEHRTLAALAAQLGIEVVAVAEPRYGVEVLPDVDAAVAHAVASGLAEGDAVLVKGSRVAGLERLAAALLVQP